MSEGRRWERKAARWKAKQMESALSDVTDRTYIVGSIRRGKPKVGDVELLAEPSAGGADLFGQSEPNVAAVQRVVRGWGEVQKEGSRMIQVVRTDGLPVEVYLCHEPAEWGTLMAIRTGPPNLSRRAVGRIRGRGWRVKRGAVWQPTSAGPGEGDAGRELMEFEDEEGWWVKVPTPTENEFFRAARLQLVPPKKRDSEVPEARGRPI